MKSRKLYVLLNLFYISQAYANPADYVKLGIDPSAYNGVVNIEQYELTSKPNYYCEYEYNVLNDQCVKIETTSSGRTCPEGWTLSKNQEFCEGYRSKSAENYCPYGTYQNERCNTIEEASAVLDCPVGYKLNAQTLQCEKRVRRTAESTCPYGSIKKGNHCLTEELRDVNISCPGHSILIDGVCETIETTDDLFSCPSKYEYSGGTCRMKDVREPVRSCLKGSLTASGCKTEEIAPATPQCADSQLLVGDSCQAKVLSESTPYCHYPFEYSTLSRMCEKKIVVPYIVSSTIGRALKHSHSVHKHLPSIDMSPKVYPVDTQVSCPEGYELAPENYCYRMEHQVPEQRCPDGSIINNMNMCEILVSSTPKLVCSPGSELQYDRCIRTAYEQPELICAEDYSLSNGMCISTTIADPSCTCPAGYEYSSTNKKCSRIIKSVPEKYCDESFELTLHDGKEVCLRYAETSMMIVCEGYEQAEGDTCVVTEVGQMTKRCESDAYYDEVTGKCYSVKSFDSSLVCDVGYTLREGLCLKRQVIDSIKVCPTAFEFDSGGVCVRYHYKSRIPLCPMNMFYDETKQLCVQIELKLRSETFPTTEAVQASETTAEALKDLEIEVPSTEPAVVKVVRRPVVDIGIFYNEEEAILRGSAEKVEQLEKDFKAGVDIKKLMDPDVEIKILDT